MNNDIKVSVIIPIFNAEMYLTQCLDSVIGQSLKEIEIICVDDGSTDKTGIILQKYSQIDSRITVFHQENKYAGCARNLGLEHSSGKYVIFWDADDFFDSDALKKLYEKCEEDQADIGICGANKYDGELQLSYPAKQYMIKERLPEKLPFNKNDITRYLFNFCSNVPWNKMFLRSFILEHGLQFQPLRQANDVYFVMMALFLAERITVVKEELIFYRIFNSSSLTGKVTETRFCTVEAFRSVLNKLEEHPEFTEEIRQSFANKAVGPLMSTLRSQSNFSAYAELYDYYRQDIMPEFGLFDREKEYFNNERDYNDLKYLQELDCQEFLLYQIHTYDRNLNRVNGQLADVRKERKELEKKCRQYNCLEKSTAYKVGRFLTFVPRIIKDKCKF